MARLSNDAKAKTIQKWYNHVAPLICSTAMYYISYSCIQTRLICTRRASKGSMKEYKGQRLRGNYAI